MQEQFAFFKTYAMAYRKLASLEEKNRFVEMLISLGIDEVEPKLGSDDASQFFEMVALPSLRNGIKLRTRRRAGGLKGGRATGECKARYGNQNARKVPIQSEAELTI